MPERRHLSVMPARISLMTSKQQSFRHRSWTLPILLVLSVAACSAKDRSDLVLVDVDLNEVPSATSLNMAVLAASTQAELKRQIVATPALQNGIAKIGLTQPAGLAGDIVVSVVASDGSGILGAGTSASVTVVPGQNAGPVTVTVKKTAVVP